MSRLAKLFRIALILFWVPFGCFSTGEGGCAPAAREAEPCRCPARDGVGAAGESSGDADAGGQLVDYGGELRVRIPAEPGMLMSLLSPHPIISRVIDHLVLEPLVERDPATGEPLPALALEWEIEPDSGRFVFSLDPRARWHDGRPVGAGDVVFTFEHVLDPAGGAIQRGDFVDLAGVSALEDGRVAFEFDRTSPGFLVALARVMILPAHVFGKDRPAGHPAARAPVGSGPFRFVSWVPGRAITLARVENWRGKKAPASRIVFEIVPDNRVALDLFRAGRLDILPDVEPSPGWARMGGRLIEYPLEAFEAWVYDTTSPLFAERAGREAVGRCIDREALRCSVLACLVDPVEGPWPRSWGLPAPAGGPIRFDVGEARRLLDEAGWRDIDGDGVQERDGRRFEFTLLVPDGARHLRRVVVMARRDLARAGIRMRPEVVSPSTYASRLREHRFDAAIVTFDNREPFDPWALFHSSAAAGGSNFGRIGDPLLDGLLDARRAADDPSIARDLAREIGERLAAQHWMTFTFAPRQQVLLREEVRGLPAVAPAFDLRHLRVEPAAGGGR